MEGCFSGQGHLQDLAIVGIETSVAVAAAGFAAGLAAEKLSAGVPGTVGEKLEPLELWHVSVVQLLPAWVRNFRRSQIVRKKLFSLRQSVNEASRFNAALIRIVLPSNVALLSSRGRIIQASRLQMPVETMV